jgi:predicted membrane protein
MEKWKDCNKNNRVWSGVILLLIGLVFFLRNMDIYIPHWVLSWHMLLIAIGLLVGYKRSFDGGGWLIMVLVGTFFTLKDILDFDFSRHFFAAGFIAVGLYLILKPKGKGFNREKWQKKQANFDPDFGFTATEDVSSETVEAKEEKEAKEGKRGKWVDENDIIDSVTVFGGTDQTVYSKNFKGGDLVAVFGGCNVNLTQADFEGVVVLEVVAIFGGIKIILPPSWIVKSEVTAIFGGSEDKRGPVIVAGNDGKIVKITGVVLFGGIEIRNF